MLRVWFVVVILCGSVEFVRDFLLLAQQLRMTNGDYVYVVADQIPSKHVLTPWVAGDDLDETARLAFESVLQVREALYYYSVMPLVFEIYIFTIKLRAHMQFPNAVTRLVNTYCKNYLYLYFRKRPTIYSRLAVWLGSLAVSCRTIVIVRSLVRLPAVPLPANNPGQVVQCSHTHVPLSPSSVIWYQSNRRERNGSIWERCGLPPI